MNSQAKPGVSSAIRKIKRELDRAEARAREEIAHPETMAIGKIRWRLLRECRVTLRLIELAHRHG